MRALLVLCCSALLALGGLVAPAPSFVPQAQAANQCIGFAYNFRWEDGATVQVDTTDGVRKFIGVSRTIATVGFDWEVPNNAQEGDQFTITLPQPIEVESNIQAFELYAPDGSVAAHALVQGIRQVVFTMTSYVNTHGLVRGSGYFSITWTDNNLDGTPLTPGAYTLNFQNCDGSLETLEARLLPEPTAGFWQEGAKNGVVSIDETNNKHEVFWWIGMDSNYQDEIGADGKVRRSFQPDTKPLTVTDPGGEGYKLTCDDLKVWNRTPPSAIAAGKASDTAPDGKVDPSRYTCYLWGERGIQISFKPQKSLTGGPDWYVDSAETIEILAKGILEPNYKDHDKLYNTAQITNMPGTYILTGDEHPGGFKIDYKTDTRDMIGKATVPQAGGAAQGARVGFKITKEVKGTPPANIADTPFTFSYQCLGDAAVSMPAIKPGETTPVAHTKAGNVWCTIQEENVPVGNKVSYKLVKKSASGDALTDNHDGSFYLWFDGTRPDEDTDLEIVATNTYKAAAFFQVKKETSDQDLLIKADTTEVSRAYKVSVTNVGTLQGTSKPVYDLPGTPEGFTLTGVTVDGQPAEKVEEGKYQVTEGDDLDPGQTKEHTVVVTYTVTPNDITSDGLAALNECKTGEAPDPHKGIFNSVEMEADTDGPGNNNACTKADMRADIVWEKISPDGTHLAGSEWKLRGSGINLYNSSGELVSTPPVVTDCVAGGACGSGDFDDKDPRPGYFRITSLKVVDTPFVDRGPGYYLQESKAPEGYKRQTKSSVFFDGTHFGKMDPKAMEALDKDGKPWVNAQGQAINYPQTGTVVWYKQDPRNSPLPGSEWTVTGGSLDKPVVIRDCEADTPETCKTQAQAADATYYDEDPGRGSFVTVLPYGSYQLQETTAPKGYLISDEKHDFKLSTDNPMQTFNQPFVNRPALGSVAWSKVDAANGKPLSGSEWTILGPEGFADLSVKDCTAENQCAGTNDVDPKAGSLKVVDLPIGAYKLQEAKAPTGYVLDSSKRDFEIKDDALDHKFKDSFKNVKASVPQLPLTGGLGADGFLLAGGAVAGLALLGAVVAGRRRRLSTH